MARRGLRFETEISWFVLGILDIVAALADLKFSAEGRTQGTFSGSNPVAQ
ncbi:MAG: hypothetical protein U0936_01400 [Planctomycetaceae bacterium]